MQWEQQSELAVLKSRIDILESTVESLRKEFAGVKDVQIQMKPTFNQTANRDRMVMGMNMLKDNEVVRPGDREKVANVFQIYKNKDQ